MKFATQLKNILLVISKCIQYLAAVVCVYFHSDFFRKYHDLAFSNAHFQFLNITI